MEKEGLEWLDKSWAGDQYNIRAYNTRHLFKETIPKEYAIGTMSLGRGDDFDPEHDSIVRVMGTRLRKRLAEYYATEGAGHHVKIFLSEVGYTPLFVAEPSADRLAPLKAGSSAPAEPGVRSALARLALRSADLVMVNSETLLAGALAIGAPPARTQDG